jgi:amino acid transporter
MPRVLGLFDVSVLASASMGPAYSLASTMGPMVAAAGTFATLALLLLAGPMLCIAIAFARVSRVAPNAGSSFSWVDAAFGPAAGAYAAWLLLLSNYFATLATALPAGIYTLDLFAPGVATRPLWDAIVGTLWILASGALLARGLRPTALTTACFLVAELLVIGVSAVVALLVHPAATPPRLDVRPAPVALGGIVAAMVLAIWMTDGWEVSAAASEESSGPAETPGRGGVVGLLVTTAFLAFAMSAYLRIGSVAGFAGHQADAMTYVAERLGGAGWRVAIVATVLVSTAATLWTTILYLSRSVYAMGRDGVLFRSLGRLDRRAMPANALWAVTLLVAAFTLLTGFWPRLTDVLALVLNGTSIFLGALFAFSALAAVRLLRRIPEENVLLAVVVPLAGAAGLLAIGAVSVAQADGPTRATEIGLLVAGLPFVLWRSRHIHPARKFSRSIPPSRASL